MLIKHRKCTITLLTRLFTFEQAHKKGADPHPTGTPAAETFHMEPQHSQLPTECTPSPTWKEAGQTDRRFVGIDSQFVACSF